MEGTRKGKEIRVGQAIEQPNDNPTDEQSSEQEVVNIELKSKQSRPKWKRWKNQARETNKKQSSKLGHSSSKRSSSEAKWESPNRKKAKKTSLSKEDQTTSPIKSPSAKFKLSWEVTTMEVMDVSESARKDLSAEAGLQPQPEAMIIMSWNVRVREYPNIPRTKRHSPKTQASNSFPL